MRHPLNAPGDFYTNAHTCIACMLPHEAAPELVVMSDAIGTCNGCYFQRQPQSRAEIEQAIDAMACSCVANHRYGGKDPAILRRLAEAGLSDQCDQRMNDDDG